MSSFKRKRAELEDSDEDEPAYGRQILPVANLPEDFNEDPTDGMQYLFTVRRDARQLPDIVRAPNPYEKPEVPMIVESSNEQTSDGHSYLPSEEWRELFELRFQNFRKNFSQPTIHVGPINDGPRRLMPEKKDRDMWWAFLSGKPESEWIPSRKSKGKSKRYEPVSNRGMRAWADDPPQSESSELAQDLWQNNDEGEVEQVLRVDPAETLPSPVGTPVPLEYLEQISQPSSKPVIKPIAFDGVFAPREPTTRLLKPIDERMALHILMYFAHWIQLHLNSPESSVYLLTESHARWIFALLSRVDEYISADDMNLLRNLARACLALLKEIKQSEQSSLSRNHELSTYGNMGETSCWIIITIIAETWKQRDLWMDAQAIFTQIRP